MDHARPKGDRRRKNAVPDAQLNLPLFEPLVDHGLQQIHVRPWVGDEEKIRRGRRPAPEAWDQWPYVESHPPHTYAGLFFDIDKPDRWEYEVDGPCPNWQIRKEGLQTTYHVAYTLEIPVARHNAAQHRIIQYYRDIYDGLSLLFGADPRFDGIMAKNPLQPPPGCTVDWIRREPYRLNELREWLPAKIPKPILTTGVGRNCDLFAHCVKLAHQPKWANIIADEGHDGLWLEYVRRLNYAEYADDPLPDTECQSIAKSCAKYSLRQYSEYTFSRIQTARNTKRWHPGQKNYSYEERANKASLMVDLGYTKPELATMFGVTVRSNLVTPPAFAIGPTAVEEKMKTDCRTRQGSKQPTKAADQP